MCFGKEFLMCLLIESLVQFLRRRYLYFGCAGVGEWIILVAV